MVYRQLTAEERYQIAALRQHGLTSPQIAAALRRHPSTIAREVKRNATPYDGAYRPKMAVEMCHGRRQRSRRNTRYGPRHFAQVEALLKQRWSPEQIVGRLRRESRPVMSHETIYLHIWKDRQNGGRPSIVERRSRFGDWEIDTVHGRGKPCVVTAVERKSGLVRIGPLPRATVEHTNARTIRLLSAEPHPVRTLTSDNGVEFHGYKHLERALGAKVYFATPHHAWERGTNENTNGLIRQYLPKATPLGYLTQLHCDQIAAHLNHRPRRRLGFLTPHEVYCGSVRLPRR